MREQVRILGTAIDSVTMRGAIELVKEFIRSGRPHMVATANAEMVMMAQEDSELAAILKAADLVVPDGAGVVWAARRLGRRVPERVAGYDLMQEILAIAADAGFRIFLFGSAPGIAEQAKAAAEKRFPGLQIVGVRNGFFTHADEPEIIQLITDARPDVLLAALGVPKQEKWLYHQLAVLNVPVVMGVGGSFDVMAGAVKRAPRWMQRASLEWFYRLIRQPQRALRMIALPKFALKILLQKKG